MRVSLISNVSSASAACTQETRRSTKCNIKNPYIFPGVPRVFFLTRSFRRVPKSSTPVKYKESLYTPLGKRPETVQFLIFYRAT
jgi:hypothetical protein